MYLFPEIIFELTTPEKLRSFFNDIVTFGENDVIRSHFYDDENDRDLEYGDIDDFCGFTLANSIESSLFLSSANCGIVFKKPVVLIAHDTHGVVTSLSVKKDDFDPTIEECAVLIRHLLHSISSGIVDNVIIGYDPAEDDDMRIITLRKSKEYDVYKEAQRLYLELNSFT